MAVVERVPQVTFKTRVRDESIEGSNPYRWEDKTTQDIFGGKKVVVFSLPGAFTPTCSSNHLPRYDELYEEFKAQGVDEIVCVSVNDAFVMFQWGKSVNNQNIFLLPDGNGEFTRKMGMLVDKANVGFGMRSWRYSMIVAEPRRARRRHGRLPHLGRLGLGRLVLLQRRGVDDGRLRRPLAVDRCIEVVHRLLHLQRYLAHRRAPQRAVQTPRQADGCALDRYGLTLHPPGTISGLAVAAIGDED